MENGPGLMVRHLTMKIGVRENQLEMDFVATFGKLGEPNGMMCHATISMVKATFARRILQVSKIFLSAKTVILSEF